MEKIEQVLALPKLNAAIVAHNKENLTFLNILLSEEGISEGKSGYNWYLYIEYVDPHRRLSPGYIELEAEEVQFLQNTLKKALYKLIILEKIKLNGFYSLNYDGIKNLRLELKSQDNDAWLEFVLFSASQKKYITKYKADELRAIIQALQTVKTAGDSMVKQLETIEALTENLVKQTEFTQLPAASQPIDGANLVRHLEKMVKKTKKAS
jgi:hypothetical protein